jgi:hypothetical protein
MLRAATVRASQFAPGRSGGRQRGECPTALTEQRIISYRNTGVLLSPRIFLSPFSGLCHARVCIRCQ